MVIYNEVGEEAPIYAKNLREDTREQRDDQHDQCEGEVRLHEGHRAHELPVEEHPHANLHHVVS